MTLVYVAIPFFVLTMVIEWWLLRDATAEAPDASRAFAGARGYTPKDAAASLSLGLGYLGTEAALKFLAIGAWLFAYQFRFFDIEPAWWSWILLFFAEDFCYYWYHRIHHEVRAFWAIHVNHHSSTHYNLSTALRQAVLTPFSKWIFWLPLPLLGFRVEMIIILQSISLLYQYWLHTETIDSRGWKWFGAIFNTPSHHRVHHGRNPQYLDRNHAGILIVWDHLFQTFEPEGDPVDYGLTKNIETHNPIMIVFHEWIAIFRDVRTAETWRGRVGYFLMPPGWREDGTGPTSKDLRRLRNAQQANNITT